jgi:hypothetical protein
VTILPDHIGFGAWSTRTIVPLPPPTSASRRDELDGQKQAIEQDIYGWSVNNGNGCTMMDSVVSVGVLVKEGTRHFCRTRLGAGVLAVSGRYLVDPGEQSFEFSLACNIYQYK